jgi:uncharacterized protein YidB (DUF937 family)
MNMGLMDSLIGAATGSLTGNNQAQAGASGAGGLDPQMLMGIVGALMNSSGGLSGILSKLQQSGLGDAAASWVGTGSNQAVSADAVGDALGPDLMGMIAQQMGGSQEQAAGTMADVLPGLIDKLTPRGQVPDDNGMSALGGLLGGGQGGGDLMGMLGGLLSKR